MKVFCVLSILLCLSTLLVTGWKAKQCYDYRCKERCEAEGNNGGVCKNGNGAIGTACTCGPKAKKWYNSLWPF